MPKRYAALVLVLAALVSLGRLAWSQDNAADTNTLVEVLQLAPGSVVGEIGAGGGELTKAIAKRVAPGGHVISSELGASRVQRLQNAVGKNAANIEVIEGHETRTNFPDACCDAVFMRNVYHHFGDPPAMNASVIRALKPGGRVAVIDFQPRSDVQTAPPGKRGGDATHGVTPATVEAELSAAGFRIIKSETIARRGFIVVGQKPAS